MLKTFGLSVAVISVFWSFQASAYTAAERKAIRDAQQWLKTSNAVDARRSNRTAKREACQAEYGQDGCDYDGRIYCRTAKVRGCKTDAEIEKGYHHAVKYFRTH